MAQPRSDISAVLITLNEESNLMPCLQALQQVVREIIVVDSHSSDNTVAVARSMGALVFPLDWEGYARTKNAGNKLAANDWILSIDADEVLSPELIESIQKLELKRGQVYLLDRITNFAGRWIKHCGWYPDWKPRLFHRVDVSWKGDFVHEVLNLPSNTRNVRLQGKLFHYSYKSLADHSKRIEKYAHLAARKMQASGKRPGFLKVWLAPSVRFLRTYLIKGGFLDGYAGFIISKRDAWLVRRKYNILRKLQAS